MTTKERLLKAIAAEAELRTAFLSACERREQAGHALEAARGILYSARDAYFKELEAEAKSSVMVKA